MSDERKIINMSDHQKREQYRRQVEERRRSLERDRQGGGGDGDGISGSFVMECLHANELGDGMLFAELHRGRFVYNANLDEWFEWAGHCWRRDKQGHTYRACEDVAVRYLEERRRVDEQVGEAAANGNSDEQRRLQALRQKIDRRVDRLRSQRGRANTLVCAHTCDNGLDVDGDDFDMNPSLLACENGVIDLRTGAIRDGRPEDYLSKSCPVSWEGIEAEAPTWDRALLEIMDGHQEMVDFMRRMFGYALLGGNPENVFVVLEGQGRNGKSLVVETVSWILGDLAGPIASELLLDQGRMRSSTGPTPDIMSLRGLRLAFATETDEGCRISPSRVKWLTGGDTLVGRNPHDKYTTQFPPTHTLFLLTNHKPHAPADDFALWERLLRIPFELSFVNREPQAQNERRQDRTLKSRFRAEASGILAWLVRGALEYQRQGLDPPPRVKEAVQEYRRDEDILADWIEERCLVGEQFQASATELYKDFHDWWEENVSKKVPKQRAFGRWLAKKFTKDKSGTVSYQGIGLKSTLY